jgi:putative transcriptional regulator
LHTNNKLQPPFFLAAPPYIEDERFKMAVILLVDLDESGALGFILNNKSTLSLDQVVDHDHLEIPGGIPVWNAGPEDPTLGIVLHNQQQHHYEQEIVPGVCLSASQETLTKLISNSLQTTMKGHSFPPPPSSQALYPFRLLIGYTGWTAGQLEDELHRGMWVTAPLDLDILFNLDHRRMWQTVIERSDFKVQAQILPHHGQWLH